ncbi:hypothetical protein ACFSKL_21375 [Belliella marina]|uniref:Uncharacterized protein n=1 Tax=Belliella marina TaxID=1644146 RepID=A0ABW4VVK9_9BACT
MKNHNTNYLYLSLLLFFIISCGSSDNEPIVDEGLASYEFTVNSGPLTGEKFQNVSFAKASTGFRSGENSEIILSTITFYEAFTPTTLFNIFWDGDQVKGFQSDESEFNRGYIRLVAVNGEDVTVFESMNVTSEVSDFKSVTMQDPIIQDKSYELRDFKMEFSGSFKNKSSGETVNISGILNFVNVIN